MSEGGRSQKPPAQGQTPGAEPAQEQAAPQSGPRQDPLWPVRDPMRLVREERQAASEQIGSKLKAWRSSKGAPGGGNVEIPQEGGAALAGDTRSKMEKHLGADLSGVKIHSGGASAQAAEGLGAR